MRKIDETFANHNTRDNDSIYHFHRYYNISIDIKKCINKFKSKDLMNI